MQRLSTAVLSLVLPTFVMAVGLALIAAAWLMTTCLFNELSFVSWPK